MDPEQFRILIAKYNSNTATAAERALVENWYEKIGGNEFLPEKGDLKEELYSGIKKHIVANQPVQTPLEKIHPNSKKSRKLFTWIASAAVLCIVFSIAVLYIKPVNRINKSLASSKEIKQISPGTNKAILTLADGSKISLSDAGNGQLAKQAGVIVTKTRNGGLIYQVIGDDLATAKYNTISTPRGGQYQLLLADGTKIWLNANSSLTFPTAFPGATRKVKLTGEAYFEVAKDKSKAFFVETAQTQVRVLGTHFNIMAYADESSQQTTLLEGAVELSKGIEKSVLKPGQQARTTDSSGQISLRDLENATEAIAWKNGYFQFEKSDLHSLMRQISRWYATDVIYEGVMPKKEYSGKIPRSVNVKTLLEMLAYSGIHCHIENNKIVVSQR